MLVKRIQYADYEFSLEMLQQTSLMARASGYSVIDASDIGVSIIIILYI